MSYETSSEFQIRYLLKSVAVYLLFMRRIASISMLAVVSALSASAATVLFDFNSSLLPETPAKTVSVTDSGSGFVATLATASSSANLGSASSAASGDWVSSGTSFDTQGLDSFMENQISFGNSWQTFISGPKGASLSLTISGLLITLETGIRFLTDYLEGDVYFKTKKERHNLHRARTQLRLVESMEEQMPEMEECVRKCFQTVNG